MIRRRDFIQVIGGAAAWRAQQSERMPRIGVITNFSTDDPDYRLQQLGRIDSRSVRIDVRWSLGRCRASNNVAELAALACDVILSVGSATTALLLRATRIVAQRD